jgi:hypothetical protein
LTRDHVLAFAHLESEGDVSEYELPTTDDR